MASDCNDISSQPLVPMLVEGDAPSWSSMRVFSSDRFLADCHLALYRNYALPPQLFLVCQLCHQVLPPKQLASHWAGGLHDQGYSSGKPVASTRARSQAALDRIQALAVQLDLDLLLADDPPSRLLDATDVYGDAAYSTLVPALPGFPTTGFGSYGFCRIQECGVIVDLRRDRNHWKRVHNLSGADPCIWAQPVSLIFLNKANKQRIPCSQIEVNEEEQDIHTVNPLALALGSLEIDIAPKVYRAPTMHIPNRCHQQLGWIRLTQGHDLGQLPRLLSNNATLDDDAARQSRCLSSESDSEEGEEEDGPTLSRIASAATWDERMDKLAKTVYRNVLGLASRSAPAIRYYVANALVSFAG